MRQMANQVKMKKKWIIQKRSLMTTKHGKVKKFKLL